jgi:hypothetical protein
MDFELEEIAGARCIHSNAKILVAADGTNCEKCGRALLKKHQTEHETDCKGDKAIKRVSHDYDELPPIEWTSPLISVLAAAAFVFAFGGGLLMVAPETPVGETPKPMPTVKLAAGFGLMVGGSLLATLGYRRERGKQLTAKRG